MYRHVRRLQESFTAVERCRAPVVCAIQGACFGGGVDLAAACDVRVCSKDAVFCVKEIDLAIVADIGTLQRLPKLIGHGRALEMALTARAVDADEAFRVGLATSVLESPSELQRNAFALAVQAQAPLTLSILLVLSTFYRGVAVALVLTVYLLASFSMGPSQFKEAHLQGA